RSLWAEIERVAGQLRRLGVRPRERVAVVLPNGPEMALAFLATSACATCAPLNPAFRAEEFEFYLRDLQARAVMVQAGLDTPPFHIHGLVGALLASLNRGASIAATPGFHGPSFFPWIDELQPTWYTAVPTMHQAILAQAAEHVEILARRQLRFIRSSSAALPP